MAPKRTILEKLGILFPYTSFLRINGEQEMTSSCSGLSALVAILLVIAILIIKLKQVFDKVTITATSQAKMDLDPPMIYISTNMHDTQFFPYMFALGYYQNINNNSSAIAVAQYRVQTGAYSSPNRTLFQQTITLEPCTAAHFAVVPNITTLQYSWGISNWMCLPLNKIWEIGGDFELSSLYKTLQVNLSCVFAQNYVDCGYYKLYTLNSFINPLDPVSPSTYYISQDTILLKAQSYYMFSSKLDQNVLRSDESVTPAVELNITTSTESHQVELQTYMQQSPQDMTILRIEKSGKTTTYSRSYFKILDALAYVGGIFSSLLAVFFFLGMYMRFYYEMKFAEYYYNSDDGRNISFFSFIKQGLFGTLSSTSLKPDWPLEQRRIELRKTVSKVLELFYLHKRIAFLEKAVELLLDDYHLKGLQLCQKVTKQESDSKLKNFQLRDRIMLYLHKYTVGEQNREREENNKDNSPGPSSSKLARNVHSREFLNENGESMSYNEVVDILEKQIKHIEMNEEEIDEEDLNKEIENHLNRLFAENESRTNNKKSKKICKMLDPWLLQSLKVIEKANQRPNRLMSEEVRN